jgi:hypothetical protein
MVGVIDMLLAVSLVVASIRGRRSASSKDLRENILRAESESDKVPGVKDSYFVVRGEVTDDIEMVEATLGKLTSLFKFPSVQRVGDMESV